MTFSDRELLFFSCFLLTLMSLLGGWLPNLFKITHVRLQLAMSLVAGFMVGIAVLHLLPHSVSIRGDNNALEAATLWLMIGLATMFVMIFAWFVPNITATDQLIINLRNDFENAFRAAKPTQWMPIWMRSFPTFGITTKLRHGPRA